VANDSTSADIHALLANAAWLERLADRLARNASDGADAAQETWLAALRSPPSAGLPARPWLASVVRHVLHRRARTERRRNRWEKEAAVSLPPLSPSAEEALDRLQRHRLLAESVAALEEPYRSTIVLRFLDGRSCAQIARETGTPEGTVRWRLREALRRLRDRSFEHTERRTWRGVLVAGAKGVWTMKVTAKVCLGAAVLALLLGLLASDHFETRQRMLSTPKDPTLGHHPAHVVDPAIRPVNEAARAASPPRFVTHPGDPASDAARLQLPRAGSPPAAPPIAIPLDRRYDFSQTELEALARNCELRTDLPGMHTVNDVPMGWLEDKDLDALDLRDGERPVVREALRGYRHALNESTQAWYVAVTRDPGAARGLDFLDLSNPDHPAVQQIVDHLSMAQIGEGARRVAEELASWQSSRNLPPADAVVASTAAFYRAQLLLGDRFESALVPALGAARARALRRGPLSGHTHRSGCP
jgi:RNA polymerase sigma-70 factor (ECF subfamily)